ncbi:dephospho-CoA kinase [Dyadobacter chenwenxiniae]|uniref:Dephospho-CoA kinase n=1 Tax=Dyadobacter chenwenxiniae TaxID=2906456 RepID=A0A9X1TD98_9BACT|nr:dephospho-CoA kinase [Dyadobacter chenwenxiniae]MCF0060957.1 dephospho-CoA kinase [Dyadobacter chenwenxiniae]UON80785.1 dephospho-CoA kinase [Dyadobacter chenwenxiniae]
MSLPLQIGITGGIGSGKSVVCKLFSCLGIPVYNADSRAKWLTNHNPQIIESVIALLGNESYTREGNYNTAYVSSLVFNNEELLKKLNAIIHPVVMQDTTDWVGNHAGLPYVVKEAAIMNKAGDRNSLDYVVVVEAPLELRITRILQRDRRSEAEIRAIVKRQVSDEERKKVGDFFIQNDEESALIPQVLMLHDIFKTGKRSH